MAEVLTGEAVVLDLSIAQFPSRIAALLIDIGVQLLGLLAVLVAVGAGLRGLNAAWAAAIFVAGYVVVIAGYPTIFETASRGKTLGKLALGLRVVGDDGSPERFRQALIRALLGVLEIWSPLVPAGLITAMINPRGKRLGDIFAGTFVIQERAPRRRDLTPEFATVPPQLAGWASNLEMSQLSDRTAQDAGSYLRRYYDLRPDFRDALGRDLAAAVASQVSPPPPPGTPPAAFLAAVLAVRRDKEYARLQAQQAQQAQAPYLEQAPQAQAPYLVQSPQAQPGLQAGSQGPSPEPPQQAPGAQPYRWEVPR